MEKNKEKALELITDLKKYENIQIADRKEDIIEILDRLEISMWLTAELAKEKMINFDDALELFSRALNEEYSPFWIVRWWAIFNLKKFETNKAKQLLLNSITNPLIDLGLLSIKSLAEAGGEEYLKYFVKTASEKVMTLPDLNIRRIEAENAIEMLMSQKNKKSK